MLASSNEAKFLLIKVLNRIHKCPSRSAVKAREAGGDSLGQRYFPIAISNNFFYIIKTN